MTTKAELRARLAAAREALPAAEAAARSERIRRHLLEVPEVRRARSVFAYVSCGNEVDTRALIAGLIDAGKTVCVPRIAGDGIMEAHCLRRLEDLGAGKYGIPAPVLPSPFEGTPDVALCPGVAFGPRGERLGRGKGFYDRFLALHPRSIAIGLAYGFQVVEDVPATPEDRRMHILVTEEGALRFVDG